MTNQRFRRLLATFLGHRKVMAVEELVEFQRELNDMLNDMTVESTLEQREQLEVLEKMVFQELSSRTPGCVA